MKHRGCFVTGTDTGVGKTVVAEALVHNLVDRGYRVAALKPIASGCRDTPHGLRNGDAELLQAVSNVPLSYEEVNPYAFEPAIAPHIAAQRVGRRIDTTDIAERYRVVAARADYLVVEGVGGWLVPLNDDATVADLASGLSLPVVLVVGIRLGCINHALLSYRAIRDSQCAVLGWVANHCVPSCDAQADIVAALALRIAEPLIAEIPWLGASVGGAHAFMNWATDE